MTYGLDAAYYPGYAAGGDTALVDGVRGGWTYGDKRWQGFIDKKRMDITIDLEKKRNFILSVQTLCRSADRRYLCLPK